MATLTLENSEGEIKHIFSQEEPIENNCIDLGKISNDTVYTKLNGDNSVNYSVEKTEINEVNFNLTNEY